MRWSILQLIKLYQRLVSPHLPTSCRFHPTCSRYAAECFEQYSFFKAFKMVLFRLGKCHPFHPGGFDPVPKR